MNFCAQLQARAAEDLSGNFLSAPLLRNGPEEDHNLHQLTANNEALQQLKFAFARITVEEVRRCFGLSWAAVHCAAGGVVCSCKRISSSSMQQLPWWAPSMLAPACKYRHGRLIKCCAADSVARAGPQTCSALCRGWHTSGEQTWS